ncbi:MAG: hypothetical protein EOM50_21425 [Erysipelotrichia bacterium]|nr:hypothetical protein [Erysipelotrichia bacterium]
MLGTRCRLIATGAMLLSNELNEFLSICFGCSVGQGYSMTENSAYGLGNRINVPSNFAGKLHDSKTIFRIRSVP